MPILTSRQKEIYDYIANFIDKKGFAPTFEEIKNHFNFSTLSTVHQHIDTLVNKNMLIKKSNSARGIELVTKNDEMIIIPLSGLISAGKPIEALETYEQISVPKNYLSSSGEHYALKVQGDSMIEEGIFDGDTVIIKKQSIAENGQTVVAIVDNNYATLKKIYYESNRFRLQPRNQALLPIYTNQVEIRGIVVSIINNNLENEHKIGLRTLDLFAGVGGIRLGFENAGFYTVFANDYDKPCKATYDLNFKNSKLIVEDIRRLWINDLPEFDFLLAGFPCQPFSVAGYRQGFEDKKERGNLFFDIAKIIETRQPKGFLLENVKNLKNHDQGKTFKIIKETLEKLGYHIKTEVFNSMEYGNIPQNRERVYIVGFKDKKYFNNFNFPKPIKLTTKVTDLLEQNVNKKYYYNEKPLYIKLKDDVIHEDKVYQWRRKYVRENKKGVCPTLTANMGTGGHNVPIIKDAKGIRKLTPLECFRLQGFPKNYKLPINLTDSALYKQAGNSVSVPVIERIAKEIFSVIKIRV